MDNKQKLLIAALVAVVVLFVVAIAVRGGSDEGDANTVSSDRNGVFSLLGGDPAAVLPDEIGGDCGRTGNQITVNGSCDLEVGPSDQRMRVVRLRTADEIDVEAPAPEDADFDIDKELDAGDEVAIAVDSEGASIDLDCGFGQTCNLTLLGGES